MIIQGKAKTLLNLMAHDGGKCPHLDALKDDLILAKVQTLTLQKTTISNFNTKTPTLKSVSNDRTALKHLNKDT